MQTITDEQLVLLRTKRQKAQEALAVMLKRMKIIQKVYDTTRAQYMDNLNEYKKLDMLYALQTKREVVTASKSKADKPFNASLKRLETILNNLPPDRRDEVLAKYKSIT